jgi:hypothetical protein
MKTETTWAHADYLHLPARADHLEGMDQHLNKAARLSRALWIALGNEELSSGDLRSRDALLELASQVADHASAAEFLFQTQAEQPEKQA